MIPPKIRVLVVEASLTARQHIVSVLNADPDLAVIGEAEDGKRAIELCRSLRPDVVTTGMMLPLMSGVAVTEYIMAHCPTPILVVSSSVNRGELYKTYDALAAGAVDVFEKPSECDPDGAWGRGLVSAVKIASRIHVITHIRGKLAALAYVNGVAQGHVDDREAAHRSPGSLIAIGACTGGPAAIVDIFRGLPADFAVPILLVIHIGDPFASAFAEWLDGQTKLRVRYARDGEPIPARGKSGVLMAPPGLHLVAAHGHLRLQNTPERNSCRPSIDVLFESLARQHGSETVACLLTGMGKDGAAGLLALRHAGALTLAQDENSSLIFGMPGEAIEMGAANRVLPLDQFSGALLDAVREPELELEVVAANSAREIAETRAAFVEELERKNAELDAFSYSVSHDLRAPLRSIDGFSQLLLEECVATLSDKGRDYLKRVRASAQRMGNMIDGLLELSRVGRAAIHRDRIDLSAIADAVIEELRTKDLDRKVAVRVEERLAAEADAGLMRIVFGNLLGNAWKFTAKAGAARIDVEAKWEAGVATYCVRDNGEGFNMEYAGSLFRPFQRLHSETDFAGTGIGLAVVHRIIDRHGGRIWAESEIDKGTAFFFMLPPAKPAGRA